MISSEESEQLDRLISKFPCDKLNECLYNDNCRATVLFRNDDWLYKENPTRWRWMTSRCPALAPSTAGSGCWLDYTSAAYIIGINQAAVHDSGK